jgi:hypothetical protein
VNPESANVIDLNEHRWKKNIAGYLNYRLPLELQFRQGQVQLALSPHLRQVLTARKWYTALLCNGVVTIDALELAKRYQNSYDLQISLEMPELVRI